MKKHLEALGVTLVLIIAWLLVGVFVIDYSLRETKISSGEVFRITPTKKIEMKVDDCEAWPCPYTPGKTITQYAVLVVNENKLHTLPVPPSYIIGLKNGYHIPIVKEKGKLTGITYAKKVKL